jgi:hypothetical protein
MEARGLRANTRSAELVRAGMLKSFKFSDAIAAVLHIQINDDDFFWTNQLHQILLFCLRNC